MNARPSRALFPAKPATLYTTDDHFGHERILPLCGRPFATVQEMDDVLIANWNKVVRPDDTVWVLGDFALGDVAHGLSYLPALNGHKYLATGNHDKPWMGHRNGRKHVAAYLDAGFELVTPWARERIGGHDVMLSHFPYAGDHADVDRYADYRLPDAGKWLIHGHVHDAWKVNGRQINVGVDVWDYTPVHEREIAAIIEAAEAGPALARTA